MSAIARHRRCAPASRTPVLWLLIGLSIVAALAAWTNFRVRTYRLPAAAAVVVFGGSFVLSVALPALCSQVFLRFGIPDLGGS
jgi:hypothetical protein